MLIRAVLDRARGDVRSLHVRSLRRQADAARDTCDWDEAARLYREVVRVQPDAEAIWVQLGHAYKEAGQFEQSDAAYRHALALQPDDADLALQIGHLRKIQGDVSAAVTCYRTALAVGLDDLHARRFLNTAEARAVLDHLPDAGSLPLPQPPLLALPSTSPAAEAESTLFFDFSDLLMYFQHNRLPTGIQRVQIELWRAMMSRAGDVPIRGCIYSDAAGGWVLLDPVRFSTLCNLTATAGSVDDADWRGALDQLRQRTASRKAIRFPPGSSLVNFGASWWMPDYMAQLRAAKARYGVRYVPLIYDLIPLITPDHVAPSLTETFAAWVASVLMHADVVAVISSRTGQDVERHARAIRPLLQPPVIMRLDAAFGEGEPDQHPAEVAARLDRFGLAAGQFVLFVGTLESRKNQMLAFKGWARLIGEEGSDAVPTLVCVGKLGFGSEMLRAYLAARPDLADKVVLLSDVMDADLRALYSGCLFTVFTSTYEGWGLPVTESLCHGKVCLVGDHSSLPEAGGRFAVYCDADSVRSFVEQARRLLFQPGIRQQLEKVIAAEFRPRTWTQVLAGFTDDLIARLACLPAPTPPVAQVAFGQRYQFSSARQRQTDRMQATAEMLRSGLGWQALEPWGMWSRQPAAQLRLQFDDPAAVGKDIVVYMTVRAAGVPTTVTVLVGRTPLVSTEIPGTGDHLLRAVLPGCVAWPPAASDDLPEVRALLLQIVTQTTTPLSHLAPEDPRHVGIGLLDFTCCATDDLASRLDVMERSTMIVAR